MYNIIKSRSGYVQCTYTCIQGDGCPIAGLTHTDISRVDRDNQILFFYEHPW